jgi:hypothetical protein
LKQFCILIVVLSPACFEAPKERARVKTLLAAQEHLFPGLFGNILRAMKPLIGINHTGGGSSLSEELGVDEEDQFDESLITFKNSKMVCKLPESRSKAQSKVRVGSKIDERKAKEVAVEVAQHNQNNNSNVNNTEENVEMESKEFEC